MGKYVKNIVFHQNINLDLATKNQKRVLISYITAPIKYNETEKIRHTNVFEMIQILHTFIERKYCIDLIDSEDTVNIPLMLEKKYDLIFGFGEPFYLASLKNPKALKIIYLTELEPGFSLRQEQERIDYLYQRNNIKVPIRRSGRHFKAQHVEIADCGILLGNTYTAKTYKEKIDPIFLLKPTGLINKNYKFVERNITNTKKNFVWFGSSGAVHKGLDILIDVFKDSRDINLYICGLDEQEKHELRMDKIDNIIDMGFVDVQSEKFLQLMEKCSYVILPSCSEAMATSVLTCMNHSLIPVVTKETGIDVYDFGIVIEDYSVEGIRQSIKKIGELSDIKVKTLHRVVYEYAKNMFNLQRFTKDFDNIINDIINKREYTNDKK